MRLYTNKNGQWFGTQRDAQKGAPRNWVEVDVPTSKQDLINWLNANQVGGGYDKPVKTTNDDWLEEALRNNVDIDCPENVPEYPDHLGHPDDDDFEDVRLVKSAESWVQWSLDTLIRGDKAEAIEMLKKGLKAQKGVA